MLASTLEAARSQMAFTLGFHIILASLGVALPAMMLIANYRGLRRGDPDALRLAQRWSKAVAVTFAVGAVTGTVLSFEFGLLWPAFTGRFGEVFVDATIGLPLIVGAVLERLEIFKPAENGRPRNATGRRNGRKSMAELKAIGRS